MAIEWLRAHCRCDRCMKEFEVGLNLNEELVAVGSSMADFVEAAVRDGGNMAGLQTSIIKIGEGDEAYNEMLCGACTAIEDATDE